MNNIMGIPAPADDFFANIGPDILPDIPHRNQTGPIDDGMTWEMIGLGLEEPLPTQEAIDELSVSAQHQD